MLKKIPMCFLVFFTLFIFSPQTAWGNMIIPILAVPWPVMLSIFALVVLLETWVMHKYLTDIPQRTLLKVTFWANLASTLIGVPAAFAIANPHVIYPPFWRVISFLPLLIFKNEAIVFFFVILCYWVVIFLLSYQIEKWVTRKFLKFASSPKTINKAVFIANLASYGALFLLAWGTLIYFYLIDVYFAS